AHVAGVVKRRAIVGDGEFMNALYVAGIFQSDGRKVRQSFEQLKVARIETAGPPAIYQLDDTEAGIAGFYRDPTETLPPHLWFFRRPCQRSECLWRCRARPRFRRSGPPSQQCPAPS